MRRNHETYYNIFLHYFGNIYHLHRFGQIGGDQTQTQDSRTDADNTGTFGRCHGNVPNHAYDIAQDKACEIYDRTSDYCGAASDNISRCFICTDTQVNI